MQVMQPYLINVSPFLQKHVLRIDYVPPDSEIDMIVLKLGSHLIQIGL